MALSEGLAVQIDAVLRPDVPLDRQVHVSVVFDPGVIFRLQLDSIAVFYGQVALDRDVDVAFLVADFHTADGVGGIRVVVHLYSDVAVHSDIRGAVLISADCLDARVVIPAVVQSVDRHAADVHVEGAATVVRTHTDDRGVHVFGRHVRLVAHVHHDRVVVLVIDRPAVLVRLVIL